MLFPSVETVPLPPDSALWALHRPGDFIDGYRVKATYPPRAAAQIAMKFPLWVRALLALRQIIMWPFGLRGEGSGKDSIAIFPVCKDTEQELVLGFDDKHLDFRISILSRDGHVHCATWVHRHNWLGRAYLAAVMPFHVFITKHMLARVAKHARSAHR
ncbi:DUF2867 domain-containing protein [Sedimentitalea sp. XS_ASV28]|uniref:DUF2867 domain-containing protein n=1 Tax=Sedimentitalea sp. XS_ASV28 TaxID=3241296 RepID=UPI003513E33C